MEKSQDYCFRHAQRYEGWQCPLCADELLKGRPAGAPGPGAAEGSPSGAGAASAGRGGPSPAARAKAKEGIERAEALLKSGTVVQALDLCESAIVLDPQNLPGHLLAARASRLLGDTLREHELLEAALPLLRLEVYGRESHWYHDIVRQTRDPELAGQVGRAYAKRAWPAADIMSLVALLITRGALVEGRVVLSGLKKQDRSLLSCGYGLQLRPSAGSDPETDDYLRSIPAKDRELVRGQMLRIQRSWLLSDDALERLTKAVRVRYEQWGPEIKQLLDAEARAMAEKSLGPDLTAMAAPWAARFGAGGAVVFVALLALVGGAAGLVLGGVVLLASAGAGFYYGRDAALKKALPGILPDIKAQLAEREAGHWGTVLAGGPAGEAPTGEAPQDELCPYCGGPVAANAAHCPQCSHSLQQAPPVAETAPGQPPEQPSEQPPEQPSEAQPASAAAPDAGEAGGEPAARPQTGPTES